MTSTLSRSFPVRGGGTSGKFKFGLSRGRGRGGGLIRNGRLEAARSLFFV